MAEWWYNKLNNKIVDGNKTAKLFNSESAVNAEIGILKNRKPPSLRAANNGRFAGVKVQ